MFLLKRLINKIDKIDKENTTECYSIIQDKSPTIIFPRYLKIDDIEKIPPKYTYISKIAILKLPYMEIFGPSKTTSITTYLEERGVDSSFENKKQLAEFVKIYDYTEAKDAELLRLLKNIHELRGLSEPAEYYMCTDEHKWTKLKSKPTLFTESEIPIYNSLSSVISPLYKYSIIYTIDDDSYWINLGEEDHRSNLFAFIGTKQEIGVLESNIADICEQNDEMPIITLSANIENKIVVRKKIINSNTISYDIYRKCDSYYEKCDTAIVYKEEIYNG